MPAVESGDKIITANGSQAPDTPLCSFHLPSSLWRRHRPASHIMGGEAEHREAERLARGHTAGAHRAGSSLHHCTGIVGSLLIALDFPRQLSPPIPSFSTNLPPVHVTPAPSSAASLQDSAHAFPVLLQIAWPRPACEHVFFLKTPRADDSLVPCHSPEG